MLFAADLALVSDLTEPLALSCTLTLRVSDVAVAEDYGLVDKVHRGLQAGIERQVIIGRNEPGVQNMHRQLHDVLGS